VHMSVVTVILSSELPTLLNAVALIRDREGRVTIHIPCGLPYPTAQSAAKRLLAALRARPKCDDIEAAAGKGPAAS